MKGKWIFWTSATAVLILALAAGLTWAQGPGPQGGEYYGQPVGTAFTYQGYLRRDGKPYNGNCDFLFSLWNDASGGSEVAIGQIKRNIQVTNGLFTVPDLDFGLGVFQGNARWLQIAVKCAGDTDYIILSPRQRLTPVPYALALPGLWTVENITSTNIIGGYSGNGLAPGVVGATISGGGSSENTCGVGNNEPCVNRVTDNYGTVGGGRYNQAGDNVGTVSDKPFATVGGGTTNTASAFAATVGGGAGNTASGPNATVGGGTGNTASGDAATVCGGRSNIAGTWNATVSGGSANLASNNSATVGGGAGNIASGFAATVPGGMGAFASHYGEMAYASGFFSAPGDAQTSVYVMRRSGVMTPNTMYELYLDGSSAGLTIASGRTVTFDILIVGRSDAAGGNESAGYHIRGVIENVGGTVAFVGTPNLVTLGEDDAAWDAQVRAIGGALKIMVQGNGETIRWVAVVRTVEVSWGGGVP